nr:hypothetical protein [uncultured Fluviicola sp.]
MKSLLSFFIVFSCFSLPLKAQSLMSDMKEVVGVLDTVKSVHIQVTCKVYSRKGGDLLNTVNTELFKEGKRSVSIFDDVSIFSDEKYGVLVNNEDKSLMLVDKNKYASKFDIKSDNGVEQFASWLRQKQSKKSFKPEMISEENGIRTYSIKDLEDLKEVAITLDSKNKSILKISYEFAESSAQKQKYIQLNYSKFLVNSKEINVNQSDYYIQKAGKFLPGNKYKSYRITTNL